MCFQTTFSILTLTCSYFCFTDILNYTFQNSHQTYPCIYNYKHRSTWLQGSDKHVDTGKCDRLNVNNTNTKISYLWYMWKYTSHNTQYTGLAQCKGDCILLYRAFCNMLAQLAYSRLYAVIKWASKITISGDKWGAILTGIQFCQSQNSFNAHCTPNFSMD